MTIYRNTVDSINTSEGKLGDRLGDELGDELGETRVTIIKTILNDPKISITKLVKILNISTTAVEKNISYLKLNGYLKRTGSTKSGFWEVLL